MFFCSPIWLYLLTVAPKSSKQEGSVAPGKDHASMTCMVYALIIATVISKGFSVIERTRFANCNLQRGIIP